MKYIKLYLNCTCIGGGRFTYTKIVIPKRDVHRYRSRKVQKTSILKKFWKYGIYKIILKIVHVT